MTLLNSGRERSFEQTLFSALARFGQFCFGPDGNIWMADGGYDRIVELDENGQIIGALGEPGHAPAQLARAHFLTFDADGRLFVADVSNWRAHVFVPTNEKPGIASYVPTVRKF